MSAGVVQEHSLEQPLANVPETVVPPALANLYAQHFRYVWRCLRSLGVNDRELDDAIQDLFLVVQKKLPEFDGRVSPKTWLYAIAIRIARRIQERKCRELRRNAPEESLERLLVSPGDLDTTLEQSEQLVRARLALEALDDEKREAFVLSQIEQLTAPEIAEIIDIPINTVYSRLRAARAAFFAEIQRLETRSRRRP
jgi:RNA polymerase sigma-70 factor (ECF subfamily)